MLLMLVVVLQNPNYCDPHTKSKSEFHKFIHFPYFTHVAHHSKLFRAQLGAAEGCLPNATLARANQDNPHAVLTAAAKSARIL